MIHEPHIAAWLHQAPGPNRQDRLDSVLRWTKEGLGNRLTRQGVKYSLGGFIVLLSEAAPYLDLQLKSIRYIPLTAGQILKLYDAVERDRSNGKSLFDPDFADVSPEAFQKAIQRHKKFWPMVPRRPKGDRNSPKSCPRSIESFRRHSLTWHAELQTNAIMQPAKHLASVLHCIVRVASGHSWASLKSRTPSRLVLRRL